MTKRFAVVGVVVVLASSCGGPSTTAPAGVFAQVAGQWNGTVKVSDFSGNTPCITALPVGFSVNAAPAAMNATAAFSQSGANLTAAVTNTASGQVMNYAGTADTASVTLQFTNCQNCTIRSGVCFNGAVQDLSPQTGTFTATVNGSTMTGTQATTYRVTDSSTGAVGQPLTVNGAVAATKQ